MVPDSNPVLARLGKVADSGRSGVFHLTGEAGGAIYLGAGVVVYAESRRTPDLDTRLQKAAAAARAGTVTSLERSWLVSEATVDAVTDLLSAKPRQARFRASDRLELSVMASLPVAVLISEVSRRIEIMRQMSVVLTADTAVARCPRLSSPAARVSDLQWAIVVRAGHPATPRTLALELGQSVFGTAMEVFRMLRLGLLAVVDAPAKSDAAAGEPGHDRPAVSFIRALAG